MPQPQVLPTLQDGYKCVLSFAEGAVTLGLVGVKPAGIDGGDLIDQTTFDNDLVHTGLPQALVKITPLTANGAYAPAALVQIMGMVNVNQEIVQSWPNGKQVTYWGALTKAEPSDMVAGGRPTLAITVSITNVNDAGAETPPEWNQTPA